MRDAPGASRKQAAGSWQESLRINIDTANHGSL